MVANANGGPAVGGRPVPPRRQATSAELKALSHPVRLRIIRELFAEPLTNRQLADRLDRDKATVLHHVRVLARNGFLDALPARPIPGGGREIPYRSTGKNQHLDVDLGTGIESVMLAAFQEEIRQARRDRGASRLVLWLTEPELEAMRDRVQSVLNEYADVDTTRMPPEGASKVAVYLSFYEPRS